MKRKIILFVFLIAAYSFSDLKAQDDYKYEVGVMTGASFYMGDANQTQFYKNSGPAGGIIFRYNKDLRWAVKTNFVVGHVSGDTRTSGNAFPFGEQASFSRTFYELGGQLEYNFFNYSDQFAYLGARRISPYVFVGLGVTAASGRTRFLSANLPFGVGLKYKVKPRLNLGFEFSFRKLFSDAFDVSDYRGGLNLDNPYDIHVNGSKNNDWYSLTMISLTWNFGVRVCPCLNID